MGDEPDVELIEAACEKEGTGSSIDRWELADNHTGCKKVTEELLKYIANGELYDLVEAPSFFSEEPAPATECC